MRTGRRPESVEHKPQLAKQAAKKAMKFYDTSLKKKYRENSAPFSPLPLPRALGHELRMRKPEARAFRLFNHAIISIESRGCDGDCIVSIDFFPPSCPQLPRILQQRSCSSASRERFVNRSPSTHLRPLIVCFFVIVKRARRET